MGQLIINQPHRLGDIIFCSPIARYYQDEGRDVIWPVAPEYLYLNKYFPWINFVDKDQVEIDLESAEMTEDYLPLRFANPIMRGLDKYDSSDKSNIMLDKYRILGLGENMWRENFSCNFDGNDLFHKIVELGASNPMRYNLINCNYGDAGKVGIFVDNGLPNIYMDYIEGYTLFDWFLIMMMADNIFTVNTSIIYLVEISGFTGGLHIYPRIPEESNLDTVRDLISKQWILHE